MAAANASLPPERRIVLRIGINLGEVIVEGEDLFGEGVNVAARLESIAPHGGIAISASAHDQVRGRIEASMEDIGVVALKNIAEPVHVYRVTPASAKSPADATGPAPGDAGGVEGVASADAVAQKGQKPSIAILPFTNLGDDPAQGFFSDGVTEDIITELSRWRSLHVRSRSASFRYRGLAVDLRQVARDLDARFIVEGSVRRMGERIRIAVQLIDSDTGAHVWAEKFDRAADEIFLVQDQVVRTIVSTLVGRVQASSAERTRRKPPSSLAAYECVLQGNALHWDTDEGRAEATRLFEQAIALDPDYGFAHAMLAAMRYDDWYDDQGGSDAPLLEAQALAQRAVVLDENESTCFSMLAWVCLMRRQFDQALRHSQRAIELNPGNQWNNADMGGLLMYLGRAEEALDWFRRAREIDPYFEPAWYWRCLGQTHFQLHDYREALSYFARTPVPTYRTAALRAACHARLGESDAARAAADECLRLKPDFTVAGFLGREPFARPVDAEHQAESLRLAGLPG
jgi:TolB-like protein